MKTGHPGILRAPCPPPQKKRSTLSPSATERRARRRPKTPSAGPPAGGPCAGLVTTPELAWFTTKLGADGGTNFSASHNPPDDNGLKFFNEHGGQPVPPEDERIVEFIRNAGEVRLIDFEQALAEGMVADIPAEA